MKQEAPKIGFIGQGWIGKNYADDFEARGLQVVRYSLEEEYVNNKELIKECPVVFIAVPTPTKKGVFDDSIVRDALGAVRDGTVVVIKSTLLPGTIKKIQADWKNIFVLFSPEFLSVATAKFDTAHPTRNIIGLPIESPEYREMAKKIMDILPKAPFELICDSTEAELIKYARNCLGYARILMANIFYDLSAELGVGFESIRDAIAADPDNGPTYANAIHKSGRGAGGECFIKDFAALSKFYNEYAKDSKGAEMLKAMEEKNIELLRKSNKDSNLLSGVYDINI